jgi:M6 family metalloprotease-like protein
MKWLAPLTLLFLLPQEPRLRAGYLLPAQAVKLAAVPVDQKPVRLTIVPVEWRDLRHPDGVNLEQLNLMFFSRKQYVQRNRANQQPFGSLADWVAQNSNETAKFGGRALDWIALDRAWSDARGFGMTAPTAETIASEAVAAALARDAKALDDATHVLIWMMGSRRDMDRSNPLGPRRLEVKAGARTLPASLLDTGLLGNVRGLESMTGLGVVAHELMHLIGLAEPPARPGTSGNGAWCLAAESWHGDNADLRAHGGAGDHRPFHLCVACKTRLGWLQPVAIDPKVEQMIALRPIESWPDALKIPIAADEYYLLESRARRGYDRNLPGAGLLIWHVKEGAFQDLVEAHGLEMPDASSRFELAVPFPALQSTCFSSDTIPASRGGVILAAIDVDVDGVAYITVGGRQTVAERVLYEGTSYRIVPRTPSISLRAATIAVALADWPDAPHAATTHGPFRDFFLGRGMTVRSRDRNDIVRPVATLADHIAQASGGLLALEGGLLTWEEQGRTEAWIPLPKAQPAYQKTTSPELAAEVLEGAAKRSERNASLLDRADLVVLVYAGRARPNTAMAPHMGSVTRGDRQIPTVVVMEEAAFDTGPVLAALLRQFKLGEKLAPRALSTDGGKAWCLAGGASAQQGRTGPCALCTVCRERLGWLTPFEGGQGAFALAPLALVSSAVKLPIDDDEYYLVENRTQWECDRALAREGLLIWHVTPREKRCTQCFENGVLDIWFVHDQPARGEPGDRPGRHVPFVSLPKKGFSLVLPRGGYELSGITCDPRGNMYFEVDLQP